MSSTRETTIWCDFPECGRFVQDSDNAEGIRRRLRERGWVYLRGGHDYCPAHAATPEGEREPSPLETLRALHRAGKAEEIPLTDLHRIRRIPNRKK